MNSLIVAAIYTIILFLVDRACKKSELIFLLRERDVSDKGTLIRLLFQKKELALLVNL